MLYVYRGIDAAGRSTQGRREAEDETSLLAELRREGLHDVSSRPAWALPASLGGRVSHGDIAVFTRLLGSLVTSTGSPAEALRLLQRLTRSPGLRRVLRAVALDVQAGHALADALEKHPTVFKRFYVNAIRAGEHSGRLAEILDRLADQLTRAHTIRAKTQSAMVYPAAVLAMAICTAWYMLRNIVPTFAGILARLHTS